MLSAAAVPAATFRNARRSMEVEWDIAWLLRSVASVLGTGYQCLDEDLRPARRIRERREEGSALVGARRAREEAQEEPVDPRAGLADLGARGQLHLVRIDQEPRDHSAQRRRIGETVERLAQRLRFLARRRPIEQVDVERLHEHPVRQVEALLRALLP